MWNKSGDYSVQNYGAIPIQRRVHYKNENAEQNIKFVTLYGYNNGLVMMVVRAHHQYAYHQLLQNIRQIGLPEHYPSSTFSLEYTLTTSNLAQLRNLITAILNTEPDFNEISNEIGDYIGLDRTQTSQEVPILSDTPHLSLINPISEDSQNSVPIAESTIFDILLDLYDLAQQLDLNSIYPILDSLHADRNEPPIPENILNLSLEDAYPPENHAPVPDPAANEKVLDELGVSADEIPDEYKCAFSSCVMTEPVYDPKATAFKFEKTKILHWLATKQINPFTNVPLTSEMLVLDTELQKAISKFVQEKVNKKNARENQASNPPILHLQPISRAEKAYEQLKREADAFIGSNPLPAKRRK